MILYPAFEDVLSIHRTLIERFGGSHGLRDRGALESALARPQTGYYRRNKRVAVTVTGAFLMVNGKRLEFTDTAAYSFLIGLYETNRMCFSELDAWLRLNVVEG